MPRAYVPSANVSTLRESATIAVSSRAKALKAAGRAVIDLGAGEPDFDTPEFIRHAAERAIEHGATRYTAVEGILPLRAAIAAQANELYQGESAIDAADVVVSTGSKQSLFNACVALFGPGDEVLIPTPAWTSYYEMIALARATPVSVFGARDRALKVTPDDLARAATPRSRGLMLNSPCNPTGAVYAPDELQAILALADERGWWVVSDEIYRRITYGAPAASVLQASPRRDRLVVVDGVAKAYAMTGWRIGWAIAPRELARTMCAFQSHTTSNAATPSQHAALTALTERAASEGSIARMVAHFRRRRDAAVRVLADGGPPLLEPQGAFYLFMDVTAASPDSPEPGTEFARRLLEEQEVAVVPGVAFGTPAWIRMSYAAPDEQVTEGARRVAALYTAMVGCAAQRSALASGAPVAQIASVRGREA